MLYDCPECGEAYAEDAGVVTLCPKCDAENTATFARPIGSPKSNRKGAWAAGIGAALFVVAMAAISWSTLDLDGDGMSAYRELQAGSDPFDGDTDGDGIADGWEYDHGLNPLSTDSDGDGQDDLREIRDIQSSGGNLCDAVALLLGCDSSGQQAAAGESDAPDAPETRSGGKGTTAVVGGVATVAAGVTARLVSAAILRK